MNVNQRNNLVIEERPLDALLAAYAARTLSPPLTALVAAHLELKLDNRAYVAALEAAHGVFLEELEPIPLVGRDRRLVNIFASQDPDETEPAPAQPPADDTILPPALRRFLGYDYAKLTWRTRLPGIKEAVVAQDDVGVTSFVCGPPGRQLPLQTRDDLKVALVLAGSFTDANGQYERGDIAFADSEADGRPMVDGDDDCVCFIVSGGRAKPSSPLGRIWQRVTGR